MPEDKFYFVYTKFNGATCMQLWVGDTTVDGKPAPCLFKTEITEQEFKFGFDYLKVKYPFKD